VCLSWKNEEFDIINARCSHKAIIMFIRNIGSNKNVRTLIWTKRVEYAVTVALCVPVDTQRLRWSTGCVLASGIQDGEFKPGRSRRIFQGEKSPARLPSVGK
jgi:hypothetical protein